MQLSFFADSWTRHIVGYLFSCLSSGYSLIKQQMANLILILLEDVFPLGRLMLLKWVSGVFCITLIVLFCEIVTAVKCLEIT